MSLVFYFLLFQITDLRCAVGLDAALYINTETALALQLGHFALQLFNLLKVLKCFKIKLFAMYVSSYP